MLNGKLIRLYQTLGKKEVGMLRKWVHSPLHQTHAEVIRLFDLILSRRVLSARSLQKEKVFAHLFPHEPYDDARFRSLVHEAYVSLRRFVGYLEEVSSTFSPGLSEAKGLLQRGMLQMAKQRTDALHKVLEEPEAPSEAILWRKFELDQLAFRLSGTQARTSDNILPDSFYHLSAHFALMTLKQACTALSHSQVSASRYKIPLLSAILDEVAAQTWEHSHPIRLYHAAYLAMRDATPEAFFAFRSELEKGLEAMSSPEQEELLLIAINVGIKLLNTGDETFALKTLDLYRLGLESGILHRGGELSRFNFKNIVALGLKVEDYAWVEDFIQSYAPLLDEAHRESYVHYSLAKLHYARGAYGPARALLAQTPMDDEFFALGVKMLLLKVYYAAGEEEALDALLDSFSRYLRRKSRLGYHRDVYLRIIAIVRKIRSLSPQDQAARDAIEEEILHARPLAERNWLLAMLEG